MNSIIMTNIIKALKGANNCFDKIQIQKYSSQCIYDHSPKNNIKTFNIFGTEYMHICSEIAKLCFKFLSGTV